MSREVTEDLSEPVSIAGQAKLRAALDRLLANSGYLTGCEQMNARLLATIEALRAAPAAASQPVAEEGGMTQALRAALERVGYYFGVTYFDDPITPTRCWLKSDGAGTSVPVSDDVLELIELLAAEEARAALAATPPAEGLDDGGLLNADPLCRHELGCIHCRALYATHEEETQ